MNALIGLLRLELTIQRRSFLYPATVVTTGLIAVVALMLPARPAPPRLAAFLVFLDPATIGLSFVGALVLMERTQGTLAALGVTPVRPAGYLAAKALTLTVPTLVSGLVVLAVATRGAFDPFRAGIALTLSSAVAVLIGLWCVAPAASMNHLVVRLLWVSTLLYLPLLGHFGVAPPAVRAALAPIPSHAMLVTLSSAADPGAVSARALVAAAAYLVLWIVVGCWRALSAFEAAMVTEGR